MTTEYVVRIQIEECEVDGDDYYPITTVGESRQAGRFSSEKLAYDHVEYLLDQADAAISHATDETKDEGG